MTPGLKKLEMATAFLDSTDVLEKVFINKGASMDDQVLERRKVCHFLYAMIFELAIKILWEVENGKECDHHHRILEFYKELSREKQWKIKELYNAQAALIKTHEGFQRTGKRVRVNDLTQYQSLEEALEANSDTVTNFKYEGLFCGKSSVIGGVIWSEEVDRIYIFPERYGIFPKAILNYAKECSENSVR